MSKKINKLYITIRENEEATIQDQLDEQFVSTLPVTAKRIHMVFYVDYDESEAYQESKKEAILWNLQDFGFLDRIEDVKVTYDVIRSVEGDYRAELSIVV